MNGDFNNNTRIDDLMIKFLDRQTTAKEEKELRAWVSQSESNKRYLTETQYLWNTVTVKDKTPFDGEAAFQRFKARVAVQQTVKKNSGHFNLYALLPWITVSLIAFLLGGTSFYIYNNHRILSKKRQYSISVPDGAKVKIKLPDKSMVWLNSGSTLRYNQKFGIKRRQVSLVGEGYFEIARNPAKPFFVHTKQVSIEALGTKFEVNAYSDDDHIDVALLKGSIQLRTVYQTHAIILRPDQEAIIDKKSQKVSVVNFAAGKSSDWTKEKFFTENETFMYLIQGIEKCYNTKIAEKKYTLNTSRFYGAFQLNRSVNDIIKIFSDNDGIIKR